MLHCPDNFVLAGMGQLICVVSTTQNNLIHYHLGSCPHFLASFQGKLMKSVQDIGHQLINSVRILLELQ